MNALSFQGVSKIYGEGDAAVHALQEIHWTLEKGAMAVVMGPSGSGKSTLLMIAGALLSPTQGRVRVNETDLYELPQSELARIRLTQIGFVFQSFNLFSSLTAAENVALPAALAGRPRKQSIDHGLSILIRLGLERRIHHTPAELSAGEKQRVALARALVNDPALILADEPTANLDSASGQQILELLREINQNQGKTILVVTHDLRIAQSARSIWWLEDGRLTPK
ncbi:MAG: ABC transporter ATP-binding protein [Thermodesulfobacteriota bacterium]